MIPDIYVTDTGQAYGAANNPELKESCSGYYSEDHVAKLREKLGLANRMLLDMTGKYEAVEAKLKAASEQEPVAWIDEHNDISIGRIRPDEFVNSFVALYPAPTSPADVQELQQRAQFWVDRCGTLEARVAELERELAKWKSAAIEREALCVKVESTLPDMMVAVIAQAREEGRKEAIQDCIIAIEESQPPETTPWDCVDAICKKLGVAP